MARKEPMEPLGPEEVAALFGVAKETVKQWRWRSRQREGGLPDPRWVRSGVPLWTRAQLEEWARETGRTIRSE